MPKTHTITFTEPPYKLQPGWERVFIVVYHHGKTLNLTFPVKKIGQTIDVKQFILDRIIKALEP
jgi:hypothetical protein